MIEGCLETLPYCSAPYICAVMFACTGPEIYGESQYSGMNKLLGMGSDEGGRRMVKQCWSPTKSCHMFLFDFEYFSVYSVPVTTRLAGKDGGMIHTFPANITMTFWEDP
jgi:hypothetical protein